MAKGFVFYEGISVLGGNPIVGIGTWGSENSKTGNILQTWILRSDIAPVDAVRTGDDVSICGDCRWRHTSGAAPICYVQRFQAPQKIYDAYMRKVYPYRFPDKIMGITVRLGSYGDPYAIPVIVWDRLMERLHATSWVGYTQFHARPEAEPFKKYCMASVATEDEALTAQRRGWRTFRITVPKAVLVSNEIMCPHYTNGTQCVDCGLCSGNQRYGAKSIAVPIHGARAKHFIAWHGQQKNVI